MRPTHAIPIILFVLIAAALFYGLTLNPKVIPSALIGKPVPTFAMPPLYEGQPGITSNDLTTGKPLIVNVFAAWCIPCRAEHPVLVDLKERGVPILGLNYKDDPDAAKRFLAELGNSYDLIGVDPDGAVGFEWGVYGVPETFVISGEGTIVYKHVGPLTTVSAEAEIVARLRALGWKEPS